MQKSYSNNSGLLRAAQIISDVFSPLLVPTYAYTLMMWLTPLVILPERGRLITMAVIALITAVIPTAAILALKGMGRVSDTAITHRRERIIPFGLAFLCYLGAAWYLYSINAPWWVGRFFLGAAMATGLALVITLKWKISAHAISFAGMTGLIIWLAFRHFLILYPMCVITVAILLCGAVSSCRLALRRHTIMQVAAGTLLGLTCVIVTLL